MAVEDFKVYTQDSGWVSLAQTLPQGTSEGQLLHWDGTQWAAASDGTADGQYLVWNDTAKRWEPGTHVTGNLPISSDDGTVVLDSPSVDTFTITTQSTERFRVNQRGMLGVGSSGLNSICMYVANTPTQATGLTGILSIPKILSADAEEVAALKTQADLGASVDLEIFYHMITGSSSGAGTAARVNGVRVVDASMTGTTKNVAFSTNLVADGLKNYSIETGTAPSRFNGEVQTSIVKGLADTDAQIKLGSQAELKNGDDSEYFPNFPSSISTKKYVDEAVEDVTWIGTQAEYDALGIYDNKRLYCITD